MFSVLEDGAEEIGLALDDYRHFNKVVTFGRAGADCYVTLEPLASYAMRASALVSPRQVWVSTTRIHQIEQVAQQDCLLFDVVLALGGTLNEDIVT